MVNTNKVLTVSYGTFSCTLEGFDDSFEMMKAVAEYFRDLSSEDRYFGAEPPKLDADTLAHIASRGTSQRISARKEGENVVLAPAEVNEPEVVTAPPATVALTPASSISERLQRIRNVVNKPSDDPYSENEHVEDIAASKSLSEVFEETTQTETNIEPQIGEVLEEEQELKAESEAAFEASDIQEENQADPATSDNNDAAPEELLDDDIENGFETDIEDAIEDLKAQDREKPEALEALNDDLEFEDSLAAALGDETLSEEEVEPKAVKTREPKVHVIKVSAPTERESAVEEDDDALERELAAILDADNANTADGDDTTLVLGPDLAVSETVAETVPEKVAPRRVKSSADTSQRTESLLRHERQDVSRLMQETDEQLSSPASKGRRSALAHLRAAVAATIADKSIETANRKEDNSEAYRDDLATVVRPRRPDTRKLRSEISEPAKTAPLRLVAEQRVEPEEPQIETAAPSEYTEPTAQKEANPAEFSTFEEYADTIGARSLADKLEAAASYLHFVRGMDGFTRPMLMNTVKRSLPAEFTREDGLRGFGELIKSGKIRRNEDGKFEASEDIGFHPDELKAS